MGHSEQQHPNSIHGGADNEAQRCHGSFPTHTAAVRWPWAALRCTHNSLASALVSPAPYDGSHALTHIHLYTPTSAKVPMRWGVLLQPRDNQECR